jgi:hypothetical protein
MTKDYSIRSEIDFIKENPYLKIKFWELRTENPYLKNFIFKANDNIIINFNGTFQKTKLFYSFANNRYVVTLCKRESVKSVLDCEFSSSFLENSKFKLMLSDKFLNVLVNLLNEDKVKLTVTDKKPVDKALEKYEGVKHFQPPVFCYRVVSFRKENKMDDLLLEYFK